MADDATGRDSDKFMLRLPDGMRDRLKAEAEANKRSMNAEIVARLQASLGAQRFFPKNEENPDFAQAVANASQRILERVETIIKEKELFPKYYPDLTFSVRDINSKERKGVIIEHKRSEMSADSALQQIKKYAQFAKDVKIGVVIFGGGVLAFDAQTGAEIPLESIPEVTDAYQRIMKADLFELRADKSKREAISGAA